MIKAHFPDLLTRVKALMIDAILLILLGYGLSTLFDHLTVVPSSWRQTCLLMVLLYDPILTSFAGGTIGHRALGLRVKQHQDSTQNIFILSALLRYAVKCFLGWISLLTVTSNSQKRALHDMIANSVVVYN
jgi:uncharacterized RDD family membrane protein YckC